MQSLNGGAGTGSGVRCRHRIARCWPRAGGPDFGAFGLRDERPAGAFQGTGASVIIEAEDQEITERPRLLEVAHVTKVEQVETAVGEDAAFARLLPALHLGGELLAATVRARVKVAATVSPAPLVLTTSLAWSRRWMGRCSGGWLASNRLMPSLPRVTSTPPAWLPASRRWPASSSSERVLMVTPRVSSASGWLGVRAVTPWKRKSEPCESTTMTLLSCRAAGMQVSMISGLITPFS